MAVLYNSVTKKLQKNCNCGGPLPSYEPVIFKFGGAGSMTDPEFTRMISERRKHERTLQPDQQKEFRNETAKLRSERRKDVEEARGLGMTFGSPYYTSAENIEKMSELIYILPQEELDELGNMGLREYRPNRNYARLGRQG